jgi:ABC-2 type transport system permease protein
MSKFTGSAKIVLKGMFAYKFDIFIWSILLPISLAVYYFFWRAVFAYSGQQAIGGFGFYDLINYYALTLIIAAITSTNVDAELARRVLDGKLSVYLTRPLSFFMQRLYENIGERGMAFLGQMLPVTIFAVVFFNLRITSSINLILFAITAVLAFILLFIFTFFLGISSFWLKKYSGIRMLRSGLVWFLSGAVVPMTFFPANIQKIFSYLPFQYTSYSPAQIFLGKYDLMASLQIVLIQVVWIAILLVLVNVCWKYAMKTFTAVGQ